MTSANEHGTPAVSVFGYLLVTTLVLLVAGGMLAPGDLQQLAVTVLSGAALVLAFRAARASRRRVMLVTGLSVAGLGLSLADALGASVGDGASRLMLAALTVLAPPAVAIAVVRDLRVTGTVRHYTVTGVLALYILIGMVFSYVYGAMDRFGDEPFFADGESATISRCFYFSFITLTTVGYGDLTAASDAGHTVAILEALIGQIYLVTIVSLIVSNLGRSPRRADGQGVSRDG